MTEVKNKKTIDIYDALFEVSKEIDNLKKDTKAFNYKYATLQQVIEVVKPLLLKNNILPISKGTMKDEQGEAYICTKLVHIPSKTTEESFIPLSFAKGATPQDLGAAKTYFRRYNLLSLLNMIVEDDDAEKLQKKLTAKPSSPKVKANDFEL